MKISNVGPAKGPIEARRRTVAPSKGGAFSQHLAEAVAASDAPAVGEARSVSSVDALLAVQEASTSTDGSARQFARRRGEDLLSRLNRLKDGILSGALAKKELADLAQTLRVPRKPSSDPKLESILAEIELRAEVEIAKLSRDV